MRKLIIFAILAALAITASADQTFDDVSADDATYIAVEKIIQRTDTLRSTFIGSEPPSDPVEGQLWIDEDDGTFFKYFGGMWEGVDSSNLSSGQHLVKNSTGTTITAGTAVWVSGWDGSSLPTITPVTSVSYPAQYITVEDIANNATGKGIYHYAHGITGFDTSGASLGDPVYFTSAGALTLSDTGSPTVGGVISLETDGVVYFSTIIGSSSGYRESLEQLVVTGTLEVGSTAVFSGNIDGPGVQAQTDLLKALRYMQVNTDRNSGTLRVLDDAAGNAMIVDAATRNLTAGSIVSEGAIDAVGALTGGTIASDAGVNGTIGYFSTSVGIGDDSTPDYDLEIATGTTGGIGLTSTEDNSITFASGSYAWQILQDFTRGDELSIYSNTLGDNVVTWDDDGNVTSYGDFVSGDDLISGSDVVANSGAVYAGAYYVGITGIIDGSRNATFADVSSSDQFLAAGYSVSTPPYSFTSDPNTGFAGVSDYLSFMTGGVRRGYIDYLGIWNVGGSSPHPSTATMLFNGTTSNYLYLSDTDQTANGYVQTRNTGSVILGSNTQATLTLNSSNNAVFDGGISPKSMADGSASNNTIYYSTTSGGLVYKDSGGAVHDLYTP